MLPRQYLAWHVAQSGHRGEFWIWSSSIVLGPTNVPVPMISSAPLCLNLSRCIAIKPSTIYRLRARTFTMSTRAENTGVPNSAPR